MKPRSQSENMASLAAIWESYAQLIRRRSDLYSQVKLQQRQLVLDKFLGLFIMVSLENKDSMCIGEMRNIGNELSQEFMRNVDTVTRKLNEELATQALEDYMLRGRGWRLLYTIDRVGVKGVSQRHDLCEVLLNLLPYCLHMTPCSLSCVPGANESPEEQEVSMDQQELLECLNDTFIISQPLSSCFHLVHKLNKLKPLGCPSLQARKIKRTDSNHSQLNLLARDQHHYKSRNRKGKRRHTKNSPSKRHQIQHISDSDKEESGSISESDTPRLDERRSKQPRFKRGLRAHMWTPFVRDDDSETDDEFVGCLNNVEGTNLSVSAFHLSHILIRLLQSLGELDMNQNVRGRTLSATILPNLLYFLRQFHPDHDKVDEECAAPAKEKHSLNSQHDIEEGNGNSVLHTNQRGMSEGYKYSRLVEATESEEVVESVPWQGALRIQLLRLVTRAVLTLAGIVATQQNGIKVLMNLKVVEHLLDLKLLDSLLPENTEAASYLESNESAANREEVGLRASAATDMICGIMQLLQAVFISLPFNPSNIGDANLLTSKLTKPEVVIRINRLIEYFELRTQQMDKTGIGVDTNEWDSIIQLKVQEKPEYVHVSDGINNIQLKESFDHACVSALSVSSSVTEKLTECSSDDSLRPNFALSSAGKSMLNPEETLEEHQNIGNCSNSPSAESTVTNTSSFISHDTPLHTPTISPQRLPSLQHVTWQSSDVTSEPIRCIGALISTLKSVKVNYIHSMKCLKRRHRNCAYGIYFDHHHDILGVPHYSSQNSSHMYHNETDHEQTASQGQVGSNVSTRTSPDYQPAPLTCIVSELSTILLDYISEAKFKASRVHLLSVIRSVGVCCCLQPGAIISAIVPHLPVFSSAVQNYALDTLTTLLLDHFQGAQDGKDVMRTSQSLSTSAKDSEKADFVDNLSIFSDSSRCVHCYLHGSSPLLAGLPSALDSGFSSCDIEEMRRQKLLERWKHLRLLQKIVISRDENLALMCAKHLMTLAIRGNNEIKEELFFGVYLRVLLMKVQISRRFSVQSKSFYSGITSKTQCTFNKIPEAVTSKKEFISQACTPDSHLSSEPLTYLNSQESLSDTSNTASEMLLDESKLDGSVPSSVMLLCVSALPYVLQVDKVMSIFLNRAGLIKLTDLLEYEHLRAPVMSVFEALVMIDERRLRGSQSDQRSGYEGGGVIQTFIDILAKRTCAVTATLQQISLQTSRDLRGQLSPVTMAEDDLLKLYKASVNNEDLADLSGNQTPDSGAREVKKEEGLSGNMLASLPVLLDMWKTCAKLCMNSRMFRAYYRESPCLYVVQETLVLALSLLGELSEVRRWSVDSTDYLATSNQTSEASSGRYSRSVSMESSKISRSCSIDGAMSTEALEEEEDESNILFSHDAKLQFIEAVMMVCFACHTISPSQKKEHEDELWLRLNSALKSCIHLEASKLSAVFQMLLNVSLPRCPSILEYSSFQMLSKLNLREREDIADEDEVMRMLQQGFEEDGEAVFTEHGYDGDTECSVCFDWKKGLEYSLEQQASQTSGTIDWPCFPAAFRLFVELMIACHQVASRGVILHSVALRLLQTLRSSKRAVQAFCSERLLQILVDGFRDVLIHAPSNGKQSTLQEIILSLVQVTAQSEITASELRQFLRLFQDNSETTNSLLLTLLAVIEKTNISPNHSATFPVKTLLAGDRLGGLSLDGSGDGNHKNNSESAVWQHAAIELDIPGIPWPPNPAGFTVSLWLCVDEYPHGGKRDIDRKIGKDRGNKSSFENFGNVFSTGRRLSLSECLLVVAVGSKEKMFEIWIHPKTASLYCRLTTSLYDVGVLKDCTFESLFSPGTWHMLTVTYYESLDGSTFMGKLNILLDGWQRHTAILDHTASLHRHKLQQQCYMCLGDAHYGANKLQTGTWKLGTVRVFKDVGLSDDWWFHLYCLGPNCQGISKSDCGDQPACYIPSLQKQIAGVSNLSWDALVGISQLSDLDISRAAQVLVFTISQPELATVFTRPNEPPDSSHGDLGLIPPSLGSVADLLTQKPVTIATRVRGRVKVRQLNTLEMAVERAGGIGAFLFLVAKIFEDSMKAVSSNTVSKDTAEHLQSTAVHVLFQLVHKSPTLAQSFLDANGYAMLAKVLTSSRSIVAYPILKVLMDACTTESVYKTNLSGSSPVLLNNPEAIIRDTNVLSHLLLHWRIWQKAGDHVTSALFGALEALVSSKHPYRNFNLKQMQACGVMNKIFNIYLERIQDGQPALSVKVSHSAAKVIKGLLGSPPDLHLLMAVMDFLLLVHPAASGFISFTPSSFYFKMWWESAVSRPSSSNQLKLNIKSHGEAVSRKQSETAANRKPEPAVLKDVAEMKTFSQASPKKAPASHSQPVVTSQGSSSSSSISPADNSYQYPPLKATKPIIEWSQAENGLDLESAGQSPDLTLISQSMPHTNSHLIKFISTQGSLTMHGKSSSSEDSDKESTVQDSPTQLGTITLARKQSAGVSLGTDDESSEATTMKHIMYLSSEVSDRQSDLEDGRRKKLVERSQSDVSRDGDSIDEEMVIIEDSKGKETETLLIDSRDEREDESDRGLMVLCVNLVEYLTQIVQEFPEAALDVIFSKVVNPKSLLVLAKNPFSDMRLAVIKLLGAHLSKAPSNLIDAFIKMDGFYLLANQLRSFSVSRQHVEAAISILLGHDFVFNDNFVVDDLGELTTIQQAAPILLLSMLDGTANDMQLCRNSLLLLSQLLEANSTMSSLLLDIGLAETMCNLATNIQRRNSSKSSPEEEEMTKTLLVDVQLVLCSAAVREFGWTGPAHFQNVEDMFALLKALEDHEFKRATETSKKRAGTARAYQMSLVVKIMEYVEKRSEELSLAASSSWMTNSAAFSSSANKSHQFVGRHAISSHSFSNPSPSNPRAKEQEASLPPRPLPIANLLLMRRTTFSSPDIMGFLSDADDKLAMSVQTESDSSGSLRPLQSARIDAGSKTSRIGSLFGRKRKMIYASVAQSDLLDRFKKILLVAVDLAVLYPREEQMRPVEQRTLNFLKETRTLTLEDRYLKHLFQSLYRFYEQSLKKEAASKQFRNPTIQGAKDVLKVQFTRLLLCLMSPRVHFDLRTYALAFIMSEQYGKEAIKYIITDKQVGTELSFYLYNLLTSWKDWLNPADTDFGYNLMRILRNAGFSIVSPDNILTQAQVNALMEEKNLIDMRYRREMETWLKRRETTTDRITVKFEPVRRRIAEQAMTVTQDVTRLQVEERKKLIALIKQSMTSQIQLKKQWQELVQDLTHERAPWYQKASYPQSWQLDPTEGPGRVRKRLQRCHLGIDKRFFLANHQQKLDLERADPPLIFLFEDDHQMSDSAALIYRLYTNEKIQHTCKCTVVSPASESKGELLVGEVCIYFVADGAITVASYTQMLLGNLDQLSITWPHTDIRELHKRWYQLQDVGLEIFLISGRTCLLAFQNTQDRDQLYSILRSSMELPNLIASESLAAVQHAWLEGEVTNYDYLMFLNKMAGRSYTDLMQYPVFPFILRNYYNNTLDLNDHKDFRNLRKPIAVQDKSREKRYMDNYEFLNQEANRPHSDDEMVRVAPFHYGSHYSNSGTVLYYMVRLPPFTQMFLSYQDNNFDIPDRTFHSLGTSWRLSSFESSTDVKELIPEFFFLPEIFINSEGFDFGRRQNGEMVNHVTLPAWCENNPRLFVLIHRQALESALVTRQLHLWIDLVFGYKQQGEEAVKAINVFHPSTYFGVDASGIRDSIKRQALLTMIRTYGQTPKQLFRNPHQANLARSLSEGGEKQKLYMNKPVPTVSGLKWGQYIGSPDLVPPVSQEIGRASVIKKLVPVRTGLIFGVEKNANILLLHGKQRDLASRSLDVMWAGVVTWGYHDNIIRIRSQPDKPLINLMPQPLACGKITCIESVPDCRLLFLAGTSGIIVVYSMTHNSSKPSNLQVRGVKKSLYGHSGPITVLYICQEFSILVSGSSDGTCIIWDLNRLTYVRSINSHCAEITTLAVSSTLGDIASVSQIDEECSSLQLHTINAAHVVTQRVPDTINCLAYSSAPEGRSVNLIAGGLSSGSIRLWSSWDLAPLRDLTRDAARLSPIISVTFSHDSQLLMSVTSEGNITLWDKDRSSRRSNADKFIPIIISGEVDK